MFSAKVFRLLTDADILLQFGAYIVRHLRY